MVINPNSLSTAQLHQILVGTINPRPIALASTMDEDGNPNLAPYSFFNVFSSNPPIMIFSSNRKVSDGLTKDTLHNVMTTKEVVINVVNFSIVHQMAVTSVGFPTGVSEFDKAGLTPIKSDEVKPFRVKESPVQYECKVQEIIPLGDKGGAGHLIICEVVRIHISDLIFDDNGKIDPIKLDTVGRMGRAFYTRASGDIFKIHQPVNQISVGYDQLPEHVQESTVLSGNDIGKLAGLPKLPTNEEILALKNDKRITYLMEAPSNYALHTYARAEIKAGHYEYALKLLMLKDMW